MLSVPPPQTGTMSAIVDSRVVLRCPISDPQYERIRANHTSLASTGCTKDFCQAGRAVHTDEPRVGENRSLLTVELEAQEFLQDLHREGFFDSQDVFQGRLEQALGEIRAGAAEGIVRSDRSYAMIGGNWTQTQQELEFGVRRAWRNSRKCIMRSHCEELELCDLRNINSSEQMAVQLLRGLSGAFNRGSIRPTVFVFPPRGINSRGPMILNYQILQFAGYKDHDGSIIGDPASVELTKTFIELGWERPKIPGRFDLLPLVTMADGDRPYMAELPADIRKLVNIRHPHYIDEFERLDLKWGAFPALTRLGFDIGGVQYTATPFIGWFMDAEIGVRDLADSFRYNVLPDVVHALGMTQGRLNDEVEGFEDLPEYEKLAMLSRAQTELNFAVHWSYLQAKVMMTDSLTASMKWCQYDDEFRQQNGFRLPADPYWLAPPQGSIIPLWHRGGAPNYQPKPMICRHVEDPVKAWGREKGRWYPAPDLMETSPRKQGSRNVPTQANATEIVFLGDKSGRRYSDCPLPIHPTIEEIISPQMKSSRSVAVFFCSAGTIAQRLATKVHKWLQRLVHNSSVISVMPHVGPLNNLSLSGLTAGSTVLIVVSSTGQGEVPPNGSAFIALCEQYLSSAPPESRKDFKFATFGNGDSRYSTTFNGAATKLNNLLRQIGGVPLAGGLCSGDTAIDPLPLGALKSWFTRLEPVLKEEVVQWIQMPGAITITKNVSASAVTVSVVPIEDSIEPYDDYQQLLLRTLKDGTLVSTSPMVETGNPRSLLLTLRIGNESFDEMSCIQILPLNAAAKVTRALQLLEVGGSSLVDIHFDDGSMSYSRFLTEFVDLELPFLQLEWLESIRSATYRGLTKQSFKKLSVLEVLRQLQDETPFLSIGDEDETRRKICLDMPLLRTRTYSLASSQSYDCRFKTNIPSARTGQNVAIMVKVLPGGRFSDTFLTDSLLPSSLKYRIVDSICGPQLRQNHLSPFIIVATGAGFGPVRALLQWRIAAAVAAGQTLPPLKYGVSLFLGIKEEDLDLTLGVLNEALALDLIDVLNIVVSNAEKKRVYDEIPRYKQLIKEKVVGKRGVVFVCTNRDAAEGTRRGFEGMLGIEGVGELEGRYLEEVF